MPVAIVPTIAKRINSWSFGERNMFCIFVYRDIKNVRLVGFNLGLEDFWTTFFHQISMNKAHVKT